MGSDEDGQEARIAAVFREAALGGPGEATVTAASAPASGRAENGNSAGSAGGADDAARAAAPEAAAAPGAGGSPLAASGTPQVPGSAAVPSIGTPIGPGPTDRCADRQDPALRALVAEALPDVAGAPEAMTTTECRPGGERGVALEARDGSTTGLLSVTYLPPGEVVPPPGIAEPPAAVIRSAPTASGGTVLVASRAERAGDPSPFADRIGDVAAYLAPRL